MIKDFQGKTVFITGAGSGIGYQTALIFAEQGAAIVATDVNQNSLEQLRPEIERHGVRCFCYSLDVTDEAAYATLVGQLAESDHLPDIVINNAGLGTTSPFLDISTEDWRLTLDVNVLGVALGCRLFSALWRAHAMPGHLVNIASMATFSPPANLSAYVASKYAVEGLSEVLVMELQDYGIDVTCVHPGIINTAIVHNKTLMKLEPAQIERLQRHYREEGVHPRVVAEDILRGVRSKASTILSGKDVGKMAFLKRFLPRKAFRKVLINGSRKIGFLPEKS
jgi:NAD(P)-dependent dehydrogenase (short-subunit alcohol dehydrogenase family)